MNENTPHAAEADINTLGFASVSKGIEANFRKVEELMKHFADAHDNLDFDPFHLSQAWANWLTAMSQNPAKLVEANFALWQDSMKLWQQAGLRLMGKEAEPVIAEARDDRRFKHDNWAEQPMFEAIKQSYLLASQWTRNVVAGAENLDPKTAEKVQFFTERFLDALSPTNFAATNPAVIEKTLETKGANLVNGLKNLLEDIEDGQGRLRIRMTDNDAFELGRNVAVTPGKVVYQNRMFQLIQ